MKGYMPEKKSENRENSGETDGKGEGKGEGKVHSREKLTNFQLGSGVQGAVLCRNQSGEQSEGEKTHFDAS